MAYGALGVVAIIALVPPAYGIGRDLLFLQRAEPDYTEGVLAFQLYSAFLDWDSRRHISQPYSHPYSFPYLDCPPGEERHEAQHDSGSIRSNQWSPDMGDYILTSALIAESEMRSRSFYVSQIVDLYSPLRIILLKTCIESSLFAARCADQVSDATWGDDASIGEGALPVGTDAMRAITYCRYYSAAVAYQRAEENAQ